MTLIKFIKSLSVGLIIFGVLAFSVVPVLAANVPTTGLLKGVTCAGSGSSKSVPGQVGSTYLASEPCGLCDIIKVVVNLSDMIISVSGAVAVLIFVYAGIMYLMVGIKPDYAAKAKGAVSAALIGLVFIFGGYAMINFLIISLVGGDSNMNGLYALTGQHGTWGVCADPPDPTKK